MNTVTFIKAAIQELELKGMDTSYLEKQLTDIEYQEDRLQEHYESLQKVLARELGTFLKENLQNN